MGVLLDSEYNRPTDRSSEQRFRWAATGFVFLYLSLELSGHLLEQFELAGPFWTSFFSVLARTLVLGAVLVLAPRKLVGKTTVALVLGAALCLQIEVLLQAVEQGRLFGVSGYIGETSIVPGYVSGLLEAICLSLLFSALLFMGIENSAARNVLSGHNHDLYLEIEQRKKADNALRAIVEGTSAAMGEEFFRSLVRCLAQTLGVRSALITEWSDEGRTRLSTLALWDREKHGDAIVYPVSGTPSEAILTGRRELFSDDVQKDFPDDATLSALNAQSYAGVPLCSSTGAVLGHLAIADDGPLEPDPRRSWILHVFAARAGAEIERLHAEEAFTQLAEIVNNTGDAIIAFDLDCNIVSWNPGAERVYGYTQEEVLGRSMFTLIPSDYENETHAAIERILQGKRIDSYRTVRLHKDGRELQISLSLSPIRSVDGEIVGISGISRDISQRLAQDQALRESEEMLRSVFENVPDFILMLNLDFKIDFINRTNAGMDPEALIGLDIFEFIPDDDANTVRKAFHEALTTRTPQAFETAANRIDGSIAYFSAHVGVVEQEGEVSALVVVATDITERREQEQALQEAEQKYRFLAEKMADLIWTMDLEGRYLYMSPSVEKLTGMNASDLIGMNMTDVLPAASARIVRDLLVRAARGELDEVVFEMELLRTAGGTVWTETSAVILKDETGEAISVQGVTRDITRRIEAEKSLKEREEQYRRIVETAQEGIWVVDNEFKTTFVNERMAEILGYRVDEMIGRSAYYYMDRESLSAADIELKQHKEGERHSHEWRLRHKDGSDVWVHVSGKGINDESGKQIGVLGMLTDITERRRAEEERKHLEDQVRHSQKLESLGVLAGGIAHDFNNILSGIMGYAGLAGSILPKDSAAREHVRKIEQASAHAADLTKQMLAYSGKGQFVIEHLDMSAIIEEMFDLLAASTSKKAVLNFELEGNLPCIKGDAGQIKQIIMNLVTNASDAVGEAPGTVTVRTGVVYATQDDLMDTYLHEDLPSGGYVYLDVLDTGAGMDEPTRGRIFDPFFTTKFAGRGLGLAAVLGIVRGHHGAIRVESAIGEGTTFRVLLPCMEAGVKVSRQPEPPVVDESTIWHGEGTVLIVEDDDMVRTLTGEILEEVGLTVLFACDGVEGVEVFEKHQNEIDVVVLDLTMPRMSGDEAFRRMRRICPAIGVILSSGYAEHEATEKFQGDGPEAFIQKPYEPSVLVEHIRQIIHSAVPN